MHYTHTHTHTQTYTKSAHSESLSVLPSQLSVYRPATCHQRSPQWGSPGQDCRAWWDANWRAAGMKRSEAREEKSNYFLPFPLCNTQLWPSDPKATFIKCHRWCKEYDECLLHLLRCFVQPTVLMTNSTERHHYLAPAPLQWDHWWSNNWCKLQSERVAV